MHFNNFVAENTLKNRKNDFTSRICERLNPPTYASKNSAENRMSCVMRYAVSTENISTGISVRSDKNFSGMLNFFLCAFG